MDNLEKIKSQIKEETNKYLDWFFTHHILVVKDNVNWLCDYLPEADREVCILGAYLHDLQRIRHIDDDHEQAGALEAKKILEEYNYPIETITKVQEIISTHSGKDGNLPTSIEGWILCSADGMAHLQDDFFLRIALMGERNIDDYTPWCMRKIERNWNNKIHFDFAKDRMRETYEATKNSSNYKYGSLPSLPDFRRHRRLFHFYSRLPHQRSPKNPNFRHNWHALLDTSLLSFKRLYWICHDCYYFYFYDYLLLSPLFKTP